MIRDRHYDPYILQQLVALTTEGTPAEQLTEYLSSLSNAAFRTAGYCLGERILMEATPKHFWSLSFTLISYHPKAFLVTVMKTLSARLSRRELTLHDKDFKPLAQLIGQQDEDIRKTITTLLPSLDDIDTVRHLFRSLGMPYQTQWIPFLLRCKTLPSYFLLFHSLRQLEHQDDFIRRTIYYLIKQGDSLSFNMASLLRTYFGYEDIRATFSLHLPPYQLSRIETSYPDFCKIMKV